MLQKNGRPLRAIFVRIMGLGEIMDALMAVVSRFRNPQPRFGVQIIVNTEEASSNPSGVVSVHHLSIKTFIQQYQTPSRLEWAM